MIIGARKLAKIKDDDDGMAVDGSIALPNQCSSLFCS
jgi:hypothetical protein